MFLHILCIPVILHRILRIQAPLRRIGRSAAQCRTRSGAQQARYRRHRLFLLRAQPAAVCLAEQSADISGSGFGSAGTQGAGQGVIAAGRCGQAAQCGMGQQVAEAAFGVVPFEFLSNDIGCGRGGGIGGYASAALGGGAQPGADHVDGYASPLPSLGLLPFGFGFFA